MAIAEMGYFGQASFTGLPAESTGGATLPRTSSAIRATNIGLNAKQAITKPPLIDGRFDYTTYQLGPTEVEGDIQFPAIHGAVNGGSSAGIVGSVWRAAMERNSSNGRLQHSFDSHVKYVSAHAQGYGGGSDQVAFKYTGCQVNTLELSVSQGETLNVNMGLIGIERQNDVSTTLTYPTRNTRIVTWNDVLAGFHIAEPTSGRVGLVKGEVLRNFTINVNNGVERFYTLNNKLFPEDITATKREITGSATALGRIFNIAQMARTNQDRCAEFSSLIFGFRAAGSGRFIVDQVGAGDPYSQGACPGSTTQFTDPTTAVVYNTCSYDCSGGFFVYFPGVIFEIETIGLSTDIFETEFNFHVLPGAQQSVFANDAGFLLGSGGSINSNTFVYTGTVPTSWFANPSGGSTTAS